MNILIIGASAGIGRQAVLLGLERGHGVKALSRNMGDTPEHNLLTKISGSATSVAILRNALAGADAVIVTVGTKDKKDTSLFVETANALVRATKELDLNVPVLVVTGFGAGESKNYLNFFMRWVIRLFLKNQYQQKSRMEDLIKGSSLKWQIVRPGMLTNGALTEKYQVFSELTKDVSINKISRADVAHYLLSETESPTRMYQTPAIGG